MSDLKALADIVLKFSPGIATALTGPIGGIVASLLSNVFGSSVEGLGDALKLDPNAEFKLKQFELEHSQELAQISSNNYANEVNDRKSARDREIEQEKITGKVDWVMHAIALIVSIGFFVLCIMNYVLQIKDDHIIILLIGQLSAGFGYIISYYFGSSNK